MKAIIYRDNGGPDVLQLVDRDLPAPGPGEVRVRVAVSGVNPTDWQARSGAAHRKQFSEVTPHLDGAGVIDAIGEGVDPSRVGQRVWLFMAAAGRPTGTAAELTVVPAERAVPLPDEVSFDVGASLGVPALTAHRALTVAEDGPRRLRPGALDGRVVLAAGGAGAVGHAVIQLARWAGATVISTISGPEKARLATAAGAHHVINYREGDRPPRSASSPRPASTSSPRWRSARTSRWTWPCCGRAARSRPTPAAGTLSARPHRRRAPGGGERRGRQGPGGRHVVTFSRPGDRQKSATPMQKPSNYGRRGHGDTEIGRGASPCTCYNPPPGPATQLIATLTGHG
ncbi:NADPH:quinone reductase [Sorangium sp. So ce269]